LQIFQNILRLVFCILLLLSMNFSFDADVWEGKLVGIKIHFEKLCCLIKSLYLPCSNKAAVTKYVPRSEEGQKSFSFTTKLDP
jgi:hypothetical protein